MENKIKYLVAGFALILFVLPLGIGGQLPSPTEPRDCYKWGETSGLYMCFEPTTGVYAMWFSAYQDMHEYYTPQLKEQDWSVGNQAVSGKRVTTLKDRDNFQTFTVGNIAYSYVKHT